MDGQIELLYIAQQALRKKPVAAPVIDKIGPKPYHFRSGPTSGPTTRPQEANEVNYINLQ